MANTPERPKFKNEEIRAAILEHLSKIGSVPHSKISGSDRLREELGIDSIGELDLAFCLEKAFQIELDDNRVRSVKTVEDFYQEVVRQLGGRVYASVG